MVDANSDKMNCKLKHVEKYTKSYEETGEQIQQIDSTSVNLLITIICIYLVYFSYLIICLMKPNSNLFESNVLKNFSKKIVEYGNSKFIILIYLTSFVSIVYQLSSLTENTVDKAILHVSLLSYTISLLFNILNLSENVKFSAFIYKVLASTSLLHAIMFIFVTVYLSTIKKRNQQ